MHENFPRFKQVPPSFCRAKSPEKQACQGVRNILQLWRGAYYGTAVVLVLLLESLECARGSSNLELNWLETSNPYLFNIAQVVIWYIFCICFELWNFAISGKDYSSDLAMFRSH